MEAPRAAGNVEAASPVPVAEAKEIDMSLLTIDSETAGGMLAESDALTDFVVNAQLMLDPATPEAVRLQAEPRLLSLLPTLQALGVFDLFAIRDPALAALVRDELQAGGR
jgi:hypothetical protein